MTIKNAGLWWELKNDIKDSMRRLVGCSIASSRTFHCQSHSPLPIQDHALQPSPRDLKPVLNGSSNDSHIGEGKSVHENHASRNALMHNDL